MNKKHLVCTILFFALLTIVFIKIPTWVNNFREKKYKEINHNSAVTIGLIYEKSTYKGKWLIFKYFYKSKEYRSEMQNNSLYNLTSIGDSIIICVDSLRPSESYIKHLK